MIIETNRGKDVDHTQYELMGVLVQVRMTSQRVACFIALYQAIRPTDVHDELQQGFHAGVVEMK
jgi:hypothetical protein